MNSPHHPQANTRTDRKSATNPPPPREQCRHREHSQLDTGHPREAQAPASHWVGAASAARFLGATGHSGTLASGIVLSLTSYSAPAVGG
jgi:hypothetical protein